MINCPICNLAVKQLHSSHFKKHGITTKEFKTKYPFISLRNESTYSTQQKKVKEAEAKNPNLCHQCKLPITGRYRNQKKFCSHACSATFNNIERHKNKLYVTTHCQHCNIKYQILKYRLNISKYCSSACASSSRRNKKIKINCDQCSVEYETTDYKLNKSIHHFCTNTCKQLFYAINSDIRGVYKTHNGLSVVSSYRKLAFDKYEHKCFYCGYQKFVDVLQVHHIDENRKNNNIENLRIVCPTCHSEVHKKYK